MPKGRLMDSSDEEEAGVNRSPRLAQQTTAHGRKTTAPVNYGEFDGASSEEDRKPGTRRMTRGRSETGTRRGSFVVADAEYDEPEHHGDGDGSFEDPFARRTRRGIIGQNIHRPEKSPEQMTDAERKEWNRKKREQERKRQEEDERRRKEEDERRKEEARKMREKRAAQRQGSYYEPMPAETSRRRDSGNSRSRKHSNGHDDSLEDHDGSFEIDHDEAVGDDYDEDDDEEEEEELDEELGSDSSDQVQSRPRRAVNKNKAVRRLSNQREPKEYRLRDRKSINYAIPTLASVDSLNRLDELEKERERKIRDGGRAVLNGGIPDWGKLPKNLTGAQLDRIFNPGQQRGGDDSDDDDKFMTPRKAAIFSNPGAAAAAGLNTGGSLFAGGAAGIGGDGPSNLGKVGGTGLADTDPLGVPSTLSFDQVGGLQQHIQQLKEMVSLPLLYPEIFQQFNITPPRGVLFHGPPGTGKTLLARALASSCSTEGKKISFFMRKGADCLSKWVGEAERQLRLLFEEAKNCQPSIIFFDEIDGLAPVRSSKQDQIHASIVSTLLALMDGMDGRGQVIIIGATNRPDAIDPALRRPGRFDREFYFPLPNHEARRKIIDIHTDGWTPPLEEEFKEELSELTKGYGGADLRALCTEAALNAVQRTYPQIYESNDRLLIKPETITITARDFIVSQKNLIPSTARASASTAKQLPDQLVPLLQSSLDQAKEVLDKVLPKIEKVNVLEEAKWESLDGGFEKEKMLQDFERLRVFRPRMILTGDSGMGQQFVGAAVLHHLEGFHVQSLDLSTLLSESSRTPEAAVVQIFVEAKRHKPSILYLPGLMQWVDGTSEALRSTVKGLLDALDPSDPILLLAVMDGEFKDLPVDVRGWFGFMKGNRVAMKAPDLHQRRDFFAELFKNIRRAPNEFPDGMPRRKRVLEKLPIAPPPPPKAPTPAQLEAEEQQDAKLIEYLKWKLGPILAELKKRYKRFCRPYFVHWNQADQAERETQRKEQQPIEGLGGTNPYSDVDLDRVHMDLYYNKYYTADQFMEDILRIQRNVQISVNWGDPEEEVIKVGQMVNHTKIMLDQVIDAQFSQNCARMAERQVIRDQATKAKSKGKEKEKDQDSQRGRANYPTRLNVRIGGVAIGDMPDIAVVERTLKRQRREGSELELSSNGEGPSAKRAKSSDDLPRLVNGDLHPAAADAFLAASHVTGGSQSGDSHEGALAGPSFLPPVANGLPRALETDQMDFDGPLASSQTAGASYLIPSGSMPNGMSSLLHDSNGPSGSLGSILGQPSTSYGMHYDNHREPSPDPLSMSQSREAADGLQHTSTVPFAGLAPPPLPRMVLESPTSPPMEDAPVLESQHSVAPTEPADDLDTTGTVIEETDPGTATVEEGDKDVSMEKEPVEVVVIEDEKEPTPAPEPTPEPIVYPDFELDEGDLDRLATELVDNAGQLTVEQLEQLRAACFELLWRARKEWNRGALIAEIRETAQGMIEEVGLSLA